MGSDQLSELADKFGGTAGKGLAVAGFFAAMVGKVAHSVKRSARVEEAVRQLKQTSEAQAKSLALARVQIALTKQDVVALSELIKRVDNSAHSNAEQIREQVSGVGERVDRVLELMVKQSGDR